MENEAECVRQILKKHGLSDEGLQKADAGFRNTVWLTDTAASGAGSMFCCVCSVSVVFARMRGYRKKF